MIPPLGPVLHRLLPAVGGVLPLLGSGVSPAVGGRHLATLPLTLRLRLGDRVLHAVGGKLPIERRPEVDPQLLPPGLQRDDVGPKQAHEPVEPFGELVADERSGGGERAPDRAQHAGRLLPHLRQGDGEVEIHNLPRRPEIHLRDRLPDRIRFLLEGRRQRASDDHAGGDGSKGGGGCQADGREQGRQNCQRGPQHAHPAGDHPQADRGSGRRDAQRKHPAGDRGHCGDELRVALDELRDDLQGSPEALHHGGRRGAHRRDDGDLQVGELRREHLHLAAETLQHLLGLAGCRS